MLSMESSHAPIANCKITPVPPLRKYISIFYIDGVPILPPLMTTEKRKKMQKFKEQAIEVEQRLLKNRRQNVQFVEETHALKVKQSTPEQMPKKPVDREDDCHSARSNKSSISQSSAYDVHADDSYLMLSSLIQSNKDSKTYKDFGTSTCNVMKTLESNMKERMQKLEKSETLIYDNRSNTIIMPMNCLEQTAAKERVQRKLEATFKTVGSANKCNYSPLMKHQIPSICVNPPTPLICSRNFTDTIRSSEDEVMSTETIQTKAVTADDFSTDESVNTPQKGSSLTPKYKTGSNISSKILKFESLQNEQNVKTASPPKALDPNCIKPPQRSATSPLLKHTISTNQNKRLVKNSASAGITDSNSIVRSNSFTLDTPSKALLDHLKQQGTAAAYSPTSAQLGQQLCFTKRTTSMNNCGTRAVLSASATRDTVESKAKKVQKSELNSRSGQGLVNTRSSSATGGFTIGIKSSNTLTNNKYTNKPRSPYEIKPVTPKAKSKRPNITKTQANSSASLMAKSVKSSTSTNHTVVCSSNNNHTSNKISNNNTSCNSSSNSSNNTIRSAKAMQSGILSEIEAEHRQKFAALIAQQQEEQKRLQFAFEMQQKQLFAQLSSSVDRMQVTPTSPVRSSNESSPTKSTSCAPNSDRSGSTLNITKSPTLSLISSSALSHSVCDLTMLEDTSCRASSINAYINKNNGRTPRRRLFDQMGSGPAINSAQDSVISNLTPNRRQQQPHHLKNERYVAAATVINAYTRGFLTRRLFQTEQIQRIVQTIRDTLIFVLNLHMETMENPAEANTSANIKLKARLLQQLSSATRTLHLVFFQTTVKERMEIISRDRKRIKTKLLSMNLKRSPRIMA